MSVSSIVRNLEAALARWRTSLLDLLSLLTPLLTRLSAGCVEWLDLPTLSTSRNAIPRRMAPPGREHLCGTELLTEQYLRRQAPVRVAAPNDFAARVMERVAAESIASETLVLATYRQPAVEHPLLRQAGAVVGTLGFSALLVLGSSFVVTLANPDLGLTVVGVLVSFAVMALSIVRLLAEAFAGIASNAGLATALMTVLLGGLLVGWAQISRIYTRSIQEA